MKKELTLVGMVVLASLSASAHHHGFWGRGGCHFWPGFAGGIVGGMIGGWGWGRTVVVGAPAYYTTPVVVQQQPVVVQQPQQVQAQPVQAQPAVQTVRASVDATPAPAKDAGTTVYVDTNGNQRVVGELLIDGKGNKMLPANYRVIRVDDLTRQ